MVGVGRASRVCAWAVGVAVAGCSDPPGTIPPAPPSTLTPAPIAVSVAPQDDPPPPIAAALASHVDERIDSLPRLDDEAAWRRVAVPSDEHAIARTEVVKVLFDRTRDELHFCQSERWPLHYDFVMHTHPEERERYPAMRDFMTRNYLRPDRAYVLGSVVHYVEADLWALELGPADTLDARGTADLLERLAARAFFGPRLRFHPRSERQIEAAARAELPTLDSDELWRGVRYQPVSLGEAIGRVRVVTGTLDPTTIHGDEILVLAETPGDLPPVRALVTGDLQTPLSHVAVLSESRGTPDMALRGVTDDPAWRAFEGRTARLVVGARSFTLEATEEAPLARERASRPLPPVDASARALLTLEGLTLEDVPRVGTKAAQLGEVRALGLPTADGFVVPMGQYLAHLERNGLDVRAATLREDARFETDRALRDRALASLRARLASAELDPLLLEELALRAAALETERVILRSSTNAEDLPGWSGAGLYDSVVVEAHDREALARALREVWASVYTLRAFDERELAGVSHDEVAMAVLVQPFLGDVRAMGVVITENPHSSRRRGYLVDLEPRGSSVTATVESRPEQWLLYLHSAPELVSRSSLVEGTLLDAASAVRLRDQLTALHEGLLARWRARMPERPVSSVDAEIALDARGAAVFLQARPYLRRR
jgi:hypothetical protein